MNFDIHTMLFMVISLTLLLSALMALAGLQVKNLRGVRYWALASLCLSFALFFTFTPLMVSRGWTILLGAMFMGAGFCLQYLGIQAFEKKRCNWRMFTLCMLLLFAQNLIFSVIEPSTHSRAIANSLVYAVINGMAARSLLIRIEQPLRTAYWFTGICFAVLTVVFLERSITVYVTPPDAYNLYASIPINPLTFFGASMMQLCLTFGFVLMLNYRLAVDLQSLASRDALTGVLNRRSLEEAAAKLWARCSRTGETLAVMMIDVDHFKSVNDKFGHQVGDEVLRRLASVAEHSVRIDDYFARYGGEEFCVLLPATTEEAAVVLAERLRQAYAATTMNFDGEFLHSTISIGVADSEHAGLEFALLVAAADQALYRAKQTGRNRVVAFSTLEIAVDEVSAQIKQD
ncbi:MAG: GGDEF domain-containing protein [Methylophilales bacterium]|nr:GGDEF domain-containing protein [Methylophilales bacterium]